MNLGPIPLGWDKNCPRAEGLRSLKGGGGGGGGGDRIR